MHKEEIEGLEESSSSEVLQAVDQDQEMFDHSDTFVDSLDSGTPEENELNELPYLPVYNAGPCIIRIPISDQILRKKKNKLLNKKVKLYNIIYFN